MFSITFKRFLGVSRTLSHLLTCVRSFKVSIHSAVVLHSDLLISRQCITYFSDSAVLTGVKYTSLKLQEVLTSAHEWGSSDTRCLPLCPRHREQGFIMASLHIMHGWLQFMDSALSTQHRANLLNNTCWRVKFDRQTWHVRAAITTAPPITIFANEKSHFLPAEILISRNCGRFICTVISITHKSGARGNHAANVKLTITKSAFWN